ncbi:hypothetical protein K402DRAFT_347511 [Aulographum hederae CBS 113979]|uniref:ACB domain-containing protein n=1 Tax=Aulographum hederae CBS 113979 TaxID=1176131 RepID=A0A6G1HC23_9PEZI|nr:hypothetical protein K402DRAFT_347511 [Aulographum hederae CBS 113979]
MSDSVDRVFSHALNTVNKIRTGSEKPPAHIRLKLYGLYKQSMEGDVEGIMDRPRGSGEEERRAQEKWDAWHSCHGLSRTEAKRRYITLLISTMHQYASPSPDARELVSELEFVWDQIKSNVPSSSSSSPLQTHGLPEGFQQLSSPPNYGLLTQQPSQSQSQSRPQRQKDMMMRTLSPTSADDQDDDEDNPADPEEEEFVDAPDSQPGSHPRPQSPSPIRNIDSTMSPPPPSKPRRAPSKRHSHPPPSSPDDAKWRRTIETALVHLTAEIAALREQLESRRLFSRGRRHTFFAWLSWAFWGFAKLVVADVVVLGVVLLWLRRRRDRRLEGAVRVLLGDAVAEVRRVGGLNLNIGGLKLPKIGTGRS